jgi:hypothetical protein
MKNLILGVLAALTLSTAVSGCYVEARREPRYGWNRCHGWHCRHRW